MSQSAPVSLLRRGAISIPAGVSSKTAQEISQSIPKNYIVNMIQNTPATSSGAKVFIIKSGTGSGKSTTLTTALAIRGRRIAITEPQRITAEEIPYDICGYDPVFKLGENIGFQTSLINKIPHRGLVFMTIGILRMHILRLTPERFMRRYSTVIVDEVHTHDLQTDVILRLLKQFLKKFWNHPECPVVILMSATMDPQKYLDYFETKNFVEVTGLSFPITTHWPLATISNLKVAIVDICNTLKGDILVFLPTAKSITQVSEALKQVNSKDTVIEVMSKTLAKGEVKQMLKPPKAGDRRIALATNAAETGLTLPYLQTVIDTGLVFTVTFNPQYNCTTMAQQPVTNSSAIQRRGRVGRKFAGDWYPLYTEETFTALVPTRPAEIYVSDFSLDMLTVIVTLTESRIVDYTVETSVEFDPATIGLIHDPTGESLTLCYDKLYQLGMITTEWHPTLTGVLTSKLRKTTLESAKMLFSAYYYGADIYKLIIITACLSIGNLGPMDKFDANETFDEVLECGFLRLLVIYEKFMRRIFMTKLSCAAIREWAMSTGLIYESWLAVIENVYELTFQLMELGIKVDIAAIPLLDNLESGPENSIDEICRLKSCIYEGYRLNTATWDERSKTYITNFKQQSIATSKPLAKLPINILSNQIMYRNMGGRMAFVSGDFICTLDHHVVTDNHFMY